jgi:hypothetical protein
MLFARKQGDNRLIGPNLSWWKRSNGKRLVIGTEYYSKKLHFGVGLNLFGENKRARSVS